MMILINGGSSSGKSAFAENLIEEQEKIIQNQDEIINELRRQLKKYRFTDTINTHNLTSVYPSIMKQRS